VTDPIPTVLGFDVEPDEFEIPYGRRDPWRGFELLVARMREWRPRLERATGRPVRFSWWLRMDPQIAEGYGTAGWVVERYGKELDELYRAGDEIGLHPHAWRWDREERHWLTDHADAHWVRECLRMSFDTFEEAFGRPCTVHRFGSHFISPGIVDFLRERGVGYDLTVEPGTRRTTKMWGTKHVTGVIPDQTRAPRTPYRPDLTDPLREESAAVSPSSLAAGPWMIPLTAIDPSPLYQPARRVLRQLRRSFQTKHRTAQLWEPGDPKRFWELIEADPLAGSRPYLCFAIRTELPLHPRYYAATIQKLEALEMSPLASRLAFVLPAEIVAGPSRVSGDPAPWQPA
jgi:hypothetical protein